MNAKEKAALADFVATVVWPSRTVRSVTTPAGEQDFAVVGSWDTTHDTAMAWIDGNRVTGAITWNSATSVQLPEVVPFGRLVIILISPGAGAGYMPRNPGAATFLADVDMGGNRLTKLAPSEESDDAVRRDEVVAIAQAMVGANYALLTGAVFTGTITIPPGTANGHAVRKDQVALLNGTQPFTAEQQGVAATNPAGLTTKGQMDAAIAASIGEAPRPPNRLASWTTPGASFTWKVPSVAEGDSADVHWIYVLLASGAGASGLNNVAPSKGGVCNGANGTLRVVLFPVTPGEILTIKPGGGGYIGYFAGISGWGAGGGGGSATSITGQAGTVYVGGAGGGRAPGSGFAGGAGGTASADYAPGGISGGQPGTLGAGTVNGGIGGWDTPATQGTVSASPSSLILAEASWAFPGEDEPAGGKYTYDPGTTEPYVAPSGAGENGGDGYVKIRWYQP